MQKRSIIGKIGHRRFGENEPNSWTTWLKIMSNSSPKWGEPPLIRRDMQQPWTPQKT